MQSNSENFEILRVVSSNSVPFLEHPSLFERNFLFTSQSGGVYTDSTELAVNQAV